MGRRGDRGASVRKGGGGGVVGDTYKRQMGFERFTMVVDKEDGQWSRYSMYTKACGGGARLAIVATLI